MKVWIGNLGKYNEGYLVGDWIELPVTKKELNDFLREKVGLQLTQQEVDEALAKDGVCYEEYYIGDIETDLSCYKFNEYQNLDLLNMLAAFEDKANDIDGINAYCEHNSISDILEICNVIQQQDDIHFYSMSYECSLTDNEAVAYWYVNDVYGGIENVSEETLNNHLDIESLGRDVRLNYTYIDDMPETAGEYYCQNEDATDKEIGEAYIELCGGIECIGNKGDYFDYDDFGRELLYDQFAVMKNEYGNQQILDYGDTIDVDYYTEEELYNEVDDVLEISDLCSSVEVNCENNEPDMDM